MHQYNIILMLFFLLFTKHFYVDFINQTYEEVKCKGIFGNFTGAKHSIKQGLATGLVLFPFVDPILLFIIVYIEIHVHYLIDYFKARYGLSDVSDKKFWVQLGCDQYLHYLTYLAIVHIILMESHYAKIY